MSDILNEVKNKLENENSNCSSIMMDAFRDFLNKKVKIEKDLNNVKSEDSISEKNSLKSEFEKLKSSNEPIFCISPSIVWSMQNCNSSMSEYLKSKNVKYKWVGKSGILITKSNLKRFLQVVFRKYTGMSLTFDKCSNGIYWTDVFKFRNFDYGALSLGKNPTIQVYDDLDKINDKSKVYIINNGFCNYEKYMKNYDPIKEQIEREKAIKVYRIQEKYRKKKIYEKVWISRIDLEKSLGWLKDIKNPQIFYHDWYVRKILSLGLVEGDDWNEVGTDCEDFEFTLDAVNKIVGRELNLEDLFNNKK